MMTYLRPFVLAGLVALGVFVGASTAEARPLRYGAYYSPVYQPYIAPVQYYAPVTPYTVSLYAAQLRTSLYLNALNSYYATPYQYGSYNFSGYSPYYGAYSYSGVYAYPSPGVLYSPYTGYILP